MGNEGSLLHIVIEESRLTSAVRNEVCLWAQEEREKKEFQNSKLALPH